MATFSTAGTLVIKTVKRVSNIHPLYHLLHILLVNPIQPYSLIPMGISHGAVTIKQYLHNNNICLQPIYNSGLHNLCHPIIRDGSTWSKSRARGEHGNVFLFSNLGAL